MDYYVYEYLREDNTPYYVGKGKNGRWYSPQHQVPRPPKDRIRFVAKNLTEKEAFDLEVKLISTYGRKDIGTGILRNMTDGGEGHSGYVLSEETKQKISNSLIGKEQSEETKQKRANALRGQKRTHEHRKRQSEAAKARWANVDSESEAEKIRRAKIKEARAKQKIITKQVTCPHCGKTGGNRIMPRYHFNNCKKRDINEHS